MRLLGQFQAFYLFIYLFFQDKISQLQKSTKRYQDNLVF